MPELDLGFHTAQLLGEPAHVPERRLGISELLEMRRSIVLPILRDRNDGESREFTTRKEVSSFIESLIPIACFFMRHAFLRDCKACSILSHCRPDVNRALREAENSALKAGAKNDSVSALSG